MPLLNVIYRQYMLLPIWIEISGIGICICHCEAKRVFEKYALNIRGRHNTFAPVFCNSPIYDFVKPFRFDIYGFLKPM